MVILAKDRVHVAPVGFEHDRIILPIIQGKADRTWLLVGPGDIRSKNFREKIVEELNSRNIEIKEMNHDRTDLFDIIRAIREIIQQEGGNSIYVNLSSGSKIQAVGCVMACMMFNKGSVTPYYVEPKEYHQQDSDQPLSFGLKRTITIPQYQIRTPPEKFVSMLHIVGEYEYITKKNLLFALQKKEILEAESDLSSMDRTLFRPFEDWKCLKVEKVGRNRRVSLTEDGKNTIKFL